ncbi:MAG: NADP-dependent malic enzyme [Clostridiales bacterium]|jgi:malate dehydrogenase (oxaloacetate-decarboxylating)|nr:NADP-dependent malic enzyme [Clostridiales bacterium]
MDYKKLALEKHAAWRGKLEMTSRAPASTAEELSLAYTPGVAWPCLAIKDDPSLSFSLTRRWNTVAVITDGTAVLGLGDIGAEAAMPVMEGKCVLFKTCADIDAIPLCLRTKNVDEIVNTVRLLAGNFGGINLEDIAAPRCFEIERRLKACCDIPVFHDDQHGTAVVALAGLLGAMKLAGKTAATAKVVLSGAGAAGTSIAKLLLLHGFKNITLVDLSGIIHRDGLYTGADLTDLSKITNLENKKGGLADAIQGADIFIGVSAPNILTGAMVAEMASKPIVFAMANPNPEIAPETAKAAGAFIVATGRSDYPNQINNVLAFPGIFRGALDARAADIDDKMKLAAAYAIAGLITETELSPEYIIPSPFDQRVAAAVAAAVADAAKTDRR